MDSATSKLRKESKPHKGKNRSWSMFPALHDDVAKLLKEDDLSFTFFTADKDVGSIQDHDTNIMGRFRCYNKSCKQGGWSSNLIAITIRMYPDQKYNARVYHQRCKACGYLSKPSLDSSYAERIAYRLKRWSGIDMDQPIYSEKPKDRPHQSNLCEGCKHGHCKYLV